MIYRFSHISLFRLAGLFIWLSLTIPIVAKIYLDDNWLNSYSILWFLSHVSFGIGFLILTRNLGQSKLTIDEWILLLAMIAVIYIINWSTFSITGLFYSLIITILLPWLMSVYQGLIILVLQNILIAWQMFSGHDELVKYDSYQFDNLFFIFFWLGISAFSYVLSYVGFKQQNAKEELRKLNSELRATQVLLTESSRINERLRISRELHDLIGHHLTALSLNLEVATHITDGKAKRQVKKAQSIARLLLSDVRDVVSSFRGKGNLNFAQALRELTDGIPRLKLHLDIDKDYTIEDPKLAQTMLRCTQELITNCIKHAKADNLWLKFDQIDELIIIEIKDDGVGHRMSIEEGNGLTGIRERVKQFNGSIEILSNKKGFGIKIIFNVS